MKMGLTVFFPAYNEEGSIKKLTTDTLSVLQQISDDYEVVIVDDGSTDATGHIADALAAEDTHVRAVHHSTNRGYGAALRTGFRNAKKNFVFYTDGDYQFDIREITRLIPLIEQCDIVSGYRVKRADPWPRRVNAFLYGWLLKVLFGLKVRDVNCAFKLYRREVIEDMPMISDGALIDAEIFVRAARKGCRVKQTGVHHYPRKIGQQTGAKISVILKMFRETFKLWLELK